ncbi:hypothetical protein WJX74_004207 [Apatococcus lobatus]|uniref:Thioredoxin domain-containing protein n=1 Tax=Apatococcus lobatus TaxID=904363 RepID=A0AAW1SEI0_9CHLO
MVLSPSVGLAPAAQLRERPQLIPYNPSVGRSAAGPSMAPVRPVFVLAGPNTVAQSAIATTATAEPSPRLHPDALARRQQAQQRQADRNHIVSLRRQLKTEGKGWWEVLDTTNCVTVAKLADYERHLTAAKEKMQLVVCLFFAPWCMACRALHPKLEQIAEQNPEVLFVKANIEQMRELASSMAVASLPYFVFYKGAGDPLTQFTASLQPNRLAKLRTEIALHKA